MSSIGTGYDLSASQFSPDGRVFQVCAVVFNPLMPKRFIVPLFNFLSFWKQMLQGANSDLFVHYSLKLTIVSVKIYYFLQIKPKAKSQL